MTTEVKIDVSETAKDAIAAKFRATKATPVAAPTTVAGVYALCRITYGKAQSALPGDLFAPVSEAERESLLSMGAARELSDAELALFEKTSAASDEMFG